MWHHRDPAKCEVAPIKHAPEECHGRSKDYMKFRGKLGRKDETEVCFDSLIMSSDGKYDKLFLACSNEQSSVMALQKFLQLYK